MLPNFLQSSFKTYKEDTNTIAAWLASKAKQCGYNSDLIDHTDEQGSSGSQPPQASGRLKGNARKKAKNAAKKQPESTPDGSENAVRVSYIIKVKEFTTLAEFIVGFEKPVVTVPKSLVSALNRAIDLRKQHSDWFKGPKGSDGPSDRVNDADQSHSYFLDILEQTRAILEPRMPLEVIDDFLSEPNGDPERPKANELSNKFADLDIQEPSEAFVNAPNVVSEPKSISNSRYEAETVHSIEEEYLAAHCLLQDVRKIRFFLRQLWKIHQEGMDITAVSVTTNTAIDFVRNLERDYLLQFPRKSDFESIVETFYKIQCLSRGEYPNRKQRPGDPLNFAVYDLAEECLLSTYIIVSSIQEVISPGSLPVYRPGHFGHRDLSSDWSTKSPRAKFQDDKLVMLEAFPDLRLMATMTSKHPLAEDELLRGFRDMAPKRKIPLWLVFAAQCFLDAQHELKRDVSRPHEQLMRIANAIRASVKQNLDFHQSLRIDTWPRTNDFHFSEIIRVIDEWVRKDIIADRLQKVSLFQPIRIRKLSFLSLQCCSTRASSSIADFTKVAA